MAAGRVCSQESSQPFINGVHVGPYVWFVRLRVALWALVPHHNHVVGIGLVVDVGPQHPALVHKLVAQGPRHLVGRVDMGLEVPQFRAWPVQAVAPWRGGRDVVQSVVADVAVGMVKVHVVWPDVVAIQVLKDRENHQALAVPSDQTHYPLHPEILEVLAMRDDPVAVRSDAHTADAQYRVPLCTWLLRVLKCDVEGRVAPGPLVRDWGREDKARLLQGPTGIYVGQLKHWRASGLM